MILVGLALAAEPADYARRAELTLPPAGPVRVALPAEWVAAEADRLDGSLLLVDAAGAPVAHAVRLSTDTPATLEDTLFPRPVGVGTWELDAADQPADGLDLQFDLSEPTRVEVSWDGGATRETLFRVDAELEDRRVALPHVRGPFRVTLPDRPDVTLEGATAVTLSPDDVPAVVETIPAPAPTLTEDGQARWVIPLPGPRTVRAVEIVTPEDVFERYAQAGPPAADGMPSWSGGATLRRVRLGDARVERVRLGGVSVADDVLVVQIGTDRGAPLQVTAFRVESAGAELLVRDAGPGPHTLYGGASKPEPAYDLGTATNALLNASPARVTAPEPAPNPAWVPLPTRLGVDGAGPPLVLARWRWARALGGGPGWVRVELDGAVLAHARADLADLRVVDAEGRQVPFLTRWTGAERELASGAPTREERGGVSLLRLPLADLAEVPIASVRVTTSQPVFQRTVSVVRDRGQLTETVREVTWSGPDTGGTLALDVGQALGRELLVRVDNGDNPPLPVDLLSVTGAVAELYAHLPEGGARLVYGRPGADAPEYDLAMLRDDVLRLPVAAGTLGAEEALQDAGPSGFDKALALAGVGLLAIGLLGMTVRVVRGVEPAEAERG